MIEVLENVDCAPNIIELQKVSTFIYIDNVLCQDEFNIFYPKDIKKQKKVKLLLSTVDINVSTHGAEWCRMKTNVYERKSFSYKEVLLLSKERNV